MVLPRVLQKALIVIFSIILGVVGDINISEDDYDLLPPVFHIDDYDKCIQEKKLFCRIHFKLTALDTNYPSKTWKLIEETKKSKRYYNHDQLYHALCFEELSYSERDVKNNLTALKLLMTKKYIDKYKSRGLKTSVEDVNCEIPTYTVRLFDVLLLCGIVLYLLLVSIATYCDITTDRLTNRSRYLILFSIRHNLTRIIKVKQNADMKKLRCIQGIRFYTTILIICCHTFCSFAGGYVANTKYLEDIPLNFFRHSIRNLFVFLVQIFFLISAWLLSYRTFAIFEKKHQFNRVKYAGLTLLNRYLRILPPVLLMVPLGSSVWVHGIISGPVKYIYSDQEYRRCQENWWINFLFLTNHYRERNMCYFTTWYLSADTQLYTFSLGLLIIIITLKKKKTIILSMLLWLIVGIIIPAIISYIHNLDIIYRITPENSKNNKFLTFEFSAIYSSTYSNGATYMLGLIFGYLHFRMEGKLLFVSNISFAFWWITSLGLPLIVIAVSSYEYSRITSAILSGILRPMYALGIGFAIFGMSQQSAGFLKTVCEWKPVLILGNFTYSTYVVHFLIVFHRTAITSKPNQVSDYVLLISCLRDIILSFLSGFFVHLLLEMPMSNMRSIFMSLFSAKYFKSDCKNKK